MCLGIPGQLVSIDAEQPDLALADVSGVKRRINIGILSDEVLAPGDWVLIHVGFAMAKMNEGEARSALDFLQELGNAYDEEIAAFERSEIA